MTAILRDINGLGSSKSSTDEEDYYKHASQIVTADAPSSILRVPSSTTSANMSGQTITGNKVATEPVVLKYDDPIPKDVERQLYRLNKLLDSVTTRWYVICFSFVTFQFFRRSQLFISRRQRGRTTNEKKRVEFVTSCYYEFVIRASEYYD
jgi:hypothetical protein